MKIEILLLLIGFASTKKADPIKAPLSVISYDDVSPLERDHLAYLEEMTKLREKRSGHSLLSILGNGLKSKIGSLAKASAGASGHFSSSSSNHDDHHEEHDYEYKSFDFWSLNKSILNTLLQAVKAIKGATIALTGKLIKGSGYLVSAKGKLISHGGEAVSDLGKKIATSAILSPIAHGSHSSSYSDHGHEGYHSEYGPSGHQDAEVAPSGIASEYSSGPDLSNKYLPSKYSSYEADKNTLFDRLPEGLIILKKIPKGHRDIEGHASENIPEFKPLSPKTPSYKDILTGLLASASNSNSNPSQKENDEKYPPLDKNPTVNNVNYLEYFKNKPVDPHEKPIEFDQTQSMDSQADFSNLETSAMNYQSFNMPEFDTIPMNFNSQFPTVFSQNMNSFGQFPQLPDPRYFSKNNGGFLPTPLTNPEQSFTGNNIYHKAKRSKNGLDIVKSITYELRPNGPVKI